MNAASPPGGPQPGGPVALPPGAVMLAKETAGFLIADGRAFVRAASLPAVALLVFEWLWIRWDYVPALGFAYAFAGVILMTAFAVACHRRVLLGIGGADGFPLAVGRREGRYVIFEVLLGLSLVGSAMVLSLLATLALGPAEHLLGGNGTVLLVVLTVLVVVFFLARLGLVLPAAAVDRDGGFGAGFRWSWSNTGPVVWHLIGAYILVAAPIYGLNWGVFFVVADAMENLNVRGILAVFDVAMQFLGTAVVTVFLSLVYRHLGGMTPAAAGAQS